MFRDYIALEQKHLAVSSVHVTLKYTSAVLKFTKWEGAKGVFSRWVVYNPNSKHAYLNGREH